MDIFEEIKMKSDYIFTLKCQFYEIYNENVIDLLDNNCKKITQSKDVVIRKETDG